MIGHVCAKSSLRRVPHSAVQSAAVAYPLDDVHFLGVLLQGSIAGTRVDDGALIWVCLSTPVPPTLLILAAVG